MQFCSFLYAKFSCCRATAITEDQARDALLALVAENCCYGKKAAEDIEIKDITTSNAYHVSVTDIQTSSELVKSLRAYASCLQTCFFKWLEIQF